MNAIGELIARVPRWVWGAAAIAANAVNIASVMGWRP
jgi:hypothetical protein